MSAQPTALESLTVCRLCNKPIGFGPPIIGETDQAHTMRLMGALHAHLEKFHLQRFKENVREVTAFYAGMMGLKLVDCYSVGDPILAAAYDAARAPIHDLTRKYRMSDEELEKLITDATPNTPFKNQLVNAAMPLARKIRDILQEAGEYEHPVVKAAREGAGKPVTA